MSEKKNISRRDFLKLAGGVAAAGTLAACAPAKPTEAPKPTEKPTEVPTVVTKKLTGITIKCAFIGGANYEEMYKAIPKFEE